MCITEAISQWGFKPIERLGESEKVILAFSLALKHYVAIKVISKADKSRKCARRFLTNLSLLQHEHIVKTLGLYENPDVFCIVMEHCTNCDLDSYLFRYGPRTEVEAKRLFQHLTHAVDYMHHTLHITHGKIECKNILLDKELNLKLANFSNSRKSDCESSLELPDDVFDMGFVLFYMFSKPQCQTQNSQVDELSVSLYCKQLIKDLFEKRICTTPGILNHDWLLTKRKRKYHNLQESEQKTKRRTKELNTVMDVSSDEDMEV